MDAIIERCCGLDVHKDSIVACSLVGKADEKPYERIQTFGTMRRDLRALSEWMSAQGCTHVAMESTGVYWMATHDALDQDFELIVANAQHLARVPGRKTDAVDSA